MLVPCVDCVCLVTLASWIELQLGWAGGSRTLCAGIALLGWAELRWAWVRAFLGFSAEGDMAQAEVCAC